MKSAKIIYLLGVSLLLAAPAPAEGHYNTTAAVTKDDYIQFAACRGVVDGLLKRIAITQKAAPQSSQAELSTLENTTKKLSSDLAALLKNIDKTDGRKWGGGKSLTTYDMNLFVTQKPKHTGETIIAYAAEKMAEYDRYCNTTVDRMKQLYN